MSVGAETPGWKRLALRASALIMCGIAAVITAEHLDSMPQTLALVGVMCLCYSFGIEAAKQAVRERRREAANERCELR